MREGEQQRDGDGDTAGGIEDEQDSRDPVSAGHDGRCTQSERIVVTVAAWRTGVTAPATSARRACAARQ